MRLEFDGRMLTRRGRQAFLRLDELDNLGVWSGVVAVQAIQHALFRPSGFIV